MTLSPTKLDVQDVIVSDGRQGEPLHGSNQQIASTWNAYADDIILFALSVIRLYVEMVELMLAICDSYASEYIISFNAEKSKC